MTLAYDEWMCVLKGRMVLLHGDGKELEVKAGQTVMIERNERFKPTFPDGACEYIPVCLPAFKPSRCIREEGESDVSKRLAELHAPKRSRLAEDAAPEVLYHMTQSKLWEEANRIVAHAPHRVAANVVLHEHLKETARVVADYGHRLDERVIRARDDPHEQRHAVGLHEGTCQGDILTSRIEIRHC